MLVHTKYLFLYMLFQSPFQIISYCRLLRKMAKILLLVCTSQFCYWGNWGLLLWKCCFQTLRYLQCCTNLFPFLNNFKTKLELMGML